MGNYYSEQPGDGERSGQMCEECSGCRCGVVGGRMDGWVGGWVRTERSKEAGWLKSNNTAQMVKEPSDPQQAHRRLTFFAGKPAIYNHKWLKTVLKFSAFYTD